MFKGAVKSSFMSGISDKINPFNYFRGRNNNNGGGSGAFGV